MRYEIMYSSYFDIKFFHYTYNTVTETLSYCVSKKRWTILIHTGNKKIELRNNFYDMTQEEYFQELLIWDYKFPIEVACTIMRLVNELNLDDNFHFDLFKIRLIEKGIKIK